MVTELASRCSRARRGEPYLPRVAGLLTRVSRKWIFDRESSRIPIEIPVTISGIDEHHCVFREATHTIDVSRRGAKIATSNFLAVGTYLCIESHSIAKPTVARVVRHAGRSPAESIWETCVELPEVNGPHSIWSISSPPDDWKTDVGEPTDARRLEYMLARDWAASFESITRRADPLAGPAKGEGSRTKRVPAGLKPNTPTSSSRRRAAERPVSDSKQAGKPVSAHASTSGLGDEVALAEPEQIRETPTSDIEERLAGMSLALETLEGRVAALVEEFQGRLEQTSTGHGARQAEELEALAQELGARWTQQFQEQAEAAVARLREEVESTGRVVEESKRQVASLAEAKLASLSQASREDYERRLAQAFEGQAQVMRQAAEKEVEWIKQAAAAAIAELQEGFQGKGARQTEELEKLTQELGARWTQQFEERAETAVARLREEVESTGRVVEESKRQVASLAEAKLASLSQASREDYERQLAQVFEGQAEVMRQAAEKEVEWIKQAAAAAMAELQEAFQGKGARQAEELEKLTQELGARWTQQFEERAETAVARLREEVESTGRVVEESKRQVASLAEAKLASLSQASREDYERQLAQVLGRVDVVVECLPGGRCEAGGGTREADAGAGGTVDAAV